MHTPYSFHDHVPLLHIKDKFPGGDCKSQFMTSRILLILSAQCQKYIGGSDIS
jgi:hypothetical protein